MVDARIDGLPADAVPLDDRGLLYGDHLFETIAFVSGRAPLWDLHMDRLERDAERLLMPPPDRELLARECMDLCARDTRCVIRITLTRGSGGRAYEPPEQPRPRRILVRRPWPGSLAAERDEGITLHTSPIRLSVGHELAGIKHGNRLEQVLAAEYARRSGVDEAVLFDCQARLVEAIAGNLVVFIENEAVTPRLTGSGVAGVGLRALSDRLGVDLPERDIDADGLRRASAVMVINSVAGIRPARRLDDRPLAIPEQSRRWQRLWDELFECEN